MMTDRKINTEADLDRLALDSEDALIPVIAQDVATGGVLMLAYANRAALMATLETGQLHFWSRSRAELWRKGATSGNTLTLHSLHADCDGDTVLAKVAPAGPACHTGERSCFGASSGPGPSVDTLARLDGTLAKRSEERPEGSYTVRLLEDRNLRLKKLGEETAELVASLATGDGGQAIEEAADLIYHLMVALRAEGVSVSAVLAELDERAG